MSRADNRALARDREELRELAVDEPRGAAARRALALAYGILSRDRTALLDRAGEPVRFETQAGASAAAVALVGKAPLSAFPLLIVDRYGRVLARVNARGRLSSNRGGTP